MRKQDKTLYVILQQYYEKDSSYLIIDSIRGRKLNENSRKILKGFIINTFIPFLRINKIKNFKDINAVLISSFQNYLLLEKKLLPQSINRQISGIKAIFSHIYMTGITGSNLIKDIVPLRRLNNMIRGCFSMDELKGVFAKKWPCNKSWLLCALIYSAGLRNSEISNLKVRDIQNNMNQKKYNDSSSQNIYKESDLSDIDFLNIEHSKTLNGIRKIPLHPKVKEALDCWIKEHGLADDDFLFVKNQNQRFYRTAKKAGDCLGTVLGITRKELAFQNITFYSGRHFYKTMLNSYNLGDIEELFMGHSVTTKVSEIYNHKNKRGEKLLLEAAKRAIEIIDICLFQPVEK